MKCSKCKEEMTLGHIVANLGAYRKELLWSEGAQERGTKGGGPGTVQQVEVEQKIQAYACASCGAVQLCLEQE